MSSEELLEVGLSLWRPADAGCQEIGEELCVDFVAVEEVVSSEGAVACLNLDARQEPLEAMRRPAAVQARSPPNSAAFAARAKSSCASRSGWSTF
jgi:hypothetical protein